MEGHDKGSLAHKGILYPPHPHIKTSTPHPQSPPTHTRTHLSSNRPLSAHSMVICRMSSSNVCEYSSLRTGHIPVSRACRCCRRMSSVSCNGKEYPTHTSSPCMLICIQIEMLRNTRTVKVCNTSLNMSLNTFLLQTLNANATSLSVHAHCPSLDEIK